MKSGLELKIRRIQLGIKGIDLAERLGIDQSYISKMENGVQRVPLHIYEKWIDVLGFSE